MAEARTERHASGVSDPGSWLAAIRCEMRVSRLSAIRREPALGGVGIVDLPAFHYFAD